MAERDTVVIKAAKTFLQNVYHTVFLSEQITA